VPSDPEIAAFRCGLDEVVPELPASVPFPIQPGRRIVLRVDAEALDWAQGLAAHCSLSLTDLVWQSLMRQADASGFYQPVPRRFTPGNPARSRPRRPNVF